MDEEIPQNLAEQKRLEFREQIHNAIQNPTSDTEQMIAWIRDTELNVQHEVVLRGFTVEEARIFLTETRTALEEAIDQGRYVGNNVVAELRPDKYREQAQNIIDDLTTKGIEIGNVFEEDHPPESFDQHELAHIVRAYELGVNLQDATLSLYFVDGGWGLKPVLTFDIPECDVITDIKISLAPQKLSESDALRVAGQLGRTRELISNKPATVAGLIKEFNDKTHGMGYDIMKYLRTGDLRKDT